MTQPMLCTEAPAQDLVRYVADPAWALQPKLNGHRVLVAVEDGAPSATGRNGQVSQHNALLRSAAFAPAFWPFTRDGSAWIDCELMDGRLHVFDLVNLVESGTVKVQPSDPFAIRITVLEAMMGDWAHPLIGLVPTAFSHEVKAEMAMAVIREHGEGVVAKRLDAPYRWGESPHAVKIKFIRDADVFVSGLAHEGKENAVLSVYDGAGREVEVGRASTYGKGTIRIGDVVIVHYGRFSSEGRLVEPRIKGLRSDKAPRECTLDQLIREQP